MTTVTVIPAPDYRIRGQAAAGIQPLKNTFGLNPLDSRLRGNDGIVGAHAAVLFHIQSIVLN